MTAKIFSLKIFNLGIKKSIKKFMPIENKKSTKIFADCKTQLKKYRKVNTKK
jgi:hypothetical protein